MSITQKRIIRGRRIKPSDDTEYLQQLTKNILSPNNKLKDFPSLTSSNKIDLSLYALFSLLIKNFIISWYVESLKLNNIEEFINELIFLFAHICRNIQGRINEKFDSFIKLLIIDLPYVINNHIAKFNEIEKLQVIDNNEEFVKIFLDNYGIDHIDEYRLLLIESIIKLLLPNENTESEISKDFIISLFDGIIMGNLIKNFSQNYVIWEIIGKLCDNNNDEKKKDTSKRDLIKLFIIDDKYNVKPNNWLQFTDFSPILQLINIITLCDNKFPLIMIIIKIFIQWIMEFTIIKKFINNFIKKNIIESLNDEKISKIINELRHLMFPNDDKFDMKPRFIPNNEDELNEIFEMNIKKILKFLKNKSIINNNEEEVRVNNLLKLFKYQEINEILIQNLIDILIKCIFPEI
ncbi:hypothetical protein DAPK24_029920 [Pichia kluyveri]|uniref:PXA domain-containing protein n=1 Tax=Pichia kluyveri TaxID=36015 RepID=A0AAV5R5Z9_PICKL|nr:hypothetical protein DAPK24_029920 [Pichia kluyveri]